MDITLVTAKPQHYSESASIYGSERELALSEALQAELAKRHLAGSYKKQPLIQRQTIADIKDT